MIVFCMVEKQSCGRCLDWKKHPELLCSKFSPDSCRGNSSNFHIQSLTLYDFSLKKKSVVFAHEVLVKSYSFFHHFPPTPAEIRVLQGSSRVATVTRSLHLEVRVLTKFLVPGPSVVLDVGSLKWR